MYLSQDRFGCKSLGSLPDQYSIAPLSERIEIRIAARCLYNTSLFPNSVRMNLRSVVCICCSSLFNHNH